MWLFKGSIAPKRYRIENDPCASGGAEFVWQIFGGVDTNEECVGGPVGGRCSLFVCDKNALAKRMGNLDATAKEKTLNLLRDSVKMLAGIRHPNVLRVKELIPESRTAISFIAEPVFLSLANARKEFVGMEDSQIKDEMRTFTLSDFDIACGLLHIGTALNFLHDNGMVHGNISPHTIFISPTGQWKLGGFMFLQKGEHQKEFLCEGLRSHHPMETIPIFPPPPSLYHAAPEMKQDPFLYSKAADMWALGAIIFEVFAQRTLVQAGGSEARVRRSLSEWHRLSSTDVEGELRKYLNLVPEGLRQPLCQMLQVSPMHRITIHQFLGSPYFHADGPIQTLRKVEGLLELSDPRDQVKVLTDLPREITSLPKRVQRDMLLPTVLHLMKNPKLAPYTVPSVLQIAKSLNQEEFAQVVAPDISRAMGKGLTQQMNLQLARHASDLIKVGDGMFVEHHVIPFICISMESPMQQICNGIMKELVPALKELRSRSGSQATLNTVQNSILPRLTKALTNKSQHQSVRVHGLVALTHLIQEKHISQEGLTTTVFPCVRESVKADRSPAVIMCALGVLEAGSEIASLEQLCQNIMPMVSALCGEKCLNRFQFNTFMEKLENIIQLIRNYRKKEFDTMQPETGSYSSNTSTNDLPHVSDYIQQQQQQQPQKPTPILQPTLQPLQPTNMNVTLFSFPNDGKQQQQQQSKQNEIDEAFDFLS